MKKSLILGGGVFLGTLISCLVLTVLVKTKDLKIAVVDFQKALNNVGEGKTCKAKLKADFSQKQKTLDDIRSKLKTKKENLESQKALLSADDRGEEQKNYKTEYLEFQKNYDDYKTELKNKEAECTNRIIAKLRTITQDLGKQGKYTAIFEKGVEDYVLYNIPSLDLTDQVISAYDAKYIGHAGLDPASP